MNDREKALRQAVQTYWKDCEDTPTMAGQALADAVEAALSKSPAVVQAEPVAIIGSLGEIKALAGPALKPGTKLYAAPGNEAARQVPKCVICGKLINWACHGIWMIPKDKAGDYDLQAIQAAAQPAVDASASHE